MSIVNSGKLVFKYVNSDGEEVSIDVETSIDEPMSKFDVPKWDYTQLKSITFDMELPPNARILDTFRCGRCTQIANEAVNCTLEVTTHDGNVLSKEISLCGRCYQIAKARIKGE